VWPVLALVLGLPLLVAATVTSIGLVGRPFPGFLLMLDAVVPTVSGYDWPADRGALFHSRVVALDGSPVSGSMDVYRRVAALPPGSAVTYTFEKAGTTFQRTLPTRTFGIIDFLQVYAVLLVIGALSLGVGVVVGFLQPATTQARVYLLLSFVGCVYTSTAIFLHRTEPPWLTPVYFAAECLFPATLVHLALVFPARVALPGLWQRVAVVAPYAISAALTVAVLAGISQRPPVLGAVHLAYLYTGFSFAVFFGTLGFRYRRSTDARVQRRILALFPSVVLGGSLTAFAFVNNAFAGGSFPLQLGLLFVPAFYLSVAYAIVRHDLFDIDRVVRQSFVYGILSLVVLVAYAAVLVVPVRLVPAFAGEGQLALGMAFAFVLAFVFDPLKQLIQRTVDRAFYRTRLDDRATISDLSAALTTLLDLPHIVSRVTHVVTDTLHLDSTAIALRGDESHPPVVWVLRHDAGLRQGPASPALDAVTAALDDAPESRDPEVIVERIQDPTRRDAVRTLLAELGARLVLPLVVRGRTIGMLALGRKRSGHFFGSADVDLLRTLANQTAIALHNAHAYEALQALTRDLDIKVRERTAQVHASNAELSRAYEELKAAQSQLVQSEKMASLGQLVAGVAHELNNPASFVHGGLANLHDFVQRLLTVLAAYEQVEPADPAERARLARLRETARLDYVLAQAPDLLRIMSEGSERIKRIVDDLRVFARADRGERGATDVPAGIESTLRLLAHRVAKGHVAVRTEAAPVPPVHANPAQLNQVWMNVLGNAIDAVDGRVDPTITIHVGRVMSANEPDGGQRPWVEARVRDNGFGIPAELVPRIFEPFFTTKPVGRGTGLGLSIAFSVVKGHGGTIQVDSTLGEGTTVTVRLPADGR